MSLTQSLRGELARQNTLVVGVMPGFVETEMIRHVGVPKLDPLAVAASIIESLRAGVEDVYPGSAAEFPEAPVKDAKKVERQFAAFGP